MLVMIPAICIAHSEVREIPERGREQPVYWTFMQFNRAGLGFILLFNQNFVDNAHSSAESLQSFVFNSLICPTHEPVIQK
jgi:hypothetical protein